MYKWLSSNNLNNLKIIQIKTGIYILNGDRFIKVIVNRQSKITLSISLRARIRITQADPEGGPGGPHSLFELSYRLVKTCFNRIFPISSLSLSFFFIMFCNSRFELCFGIFLFFSKQIVLKSGYFTIHLRRDKQLWKIR